MATEATARSLAGKLQELRSTLSDDEQEALGDLLQTVVGQMESSIKTAPRRGQRLIAPRGSDRAIAEVRMASDMMTIEEDDFATPTITITTTVTVMASHPVITCTLAE
ncbi:hypothetical protein Aple_036160 [Acrocarpospora pleiomorpha]|uniref:Uncharacterized protein n=1 Tax=Acrocarpospora pleiomorpha TaxID=90975 RepID=A0A5M3XIE4_9ACTN|nr:hypothetical protein [Acrocarpospora pleiomorpha]GES20720.1 hypothetical protein Aple_036160 [Acrocarpospora pleiomorpha]